MACCSSCGSKAPMPSAAKHRNGASTSVSGSAGTSRCRGFGGGPGSAPTQSMGRRAYGLDEAVRGHAQESTWSPGRGFDACAAAGALTDTLITRAASVLGGAPWRSTASSSLRMAARPRVRGMRRAVISLPASECAWMAMTQMDAPSRCRTRQEAKHSGSIAVGASRSPGGRRRLLGFRGTSPSGSALCSAWAAKRRAASCTSSGMRTVPAPTPESAGRIAMAVCPTSFISGAQGGRAWAPLSALNSINPAARTCGPSEDYACST